MAKSTTKTKAKPNAAPLTPGQKAATTRKKNEEQRYVMYKANHLKAIDELNEQYRNGFFLEVERTGEFDWRKHVYADYNKGEIHFISMRLPSEYNQYEDNVCVCEEEPFGRYLMALRHDRLRYVFPDAWGAALFETKVKGKVLVSSEALDDFNIKTALTYQDARCVRRWHERTVFGRSYIHPIP